MDLSEILPKNHPYLDTHIAVVENADSVADLLEEIENWKRGLCSWDDVEKILTTVREDIHESTQ